MAASVPDWDTDDDDGGCYGTIFAGPEAEQRAHYYEALQTKRLPTIRDGASSHRSSRCDSSELENQ